MGGCGQVKFKSHIILHKGLECQWIQISRKLYTVDMGMQKAHAHMRVSVGFPNLTNQI